MLDPLTKLIGVRKTPTQKMLGRRKIDGNTGKPGVYTWDTFEDVLDQVGKFGMGLSSLLSGQPKPLFGLCSKARPEWLIADLAGQGYGLVSVVLYENYSAQNVRHVLRETGLKVLVCDVDSIGLFLTSQAPSLKILISMDPVPDYLHLWAKEKGVEVLEMSSVMSLGSRRGGLAVNSLVSPIPSNELMTIAYTPGTTDSPKGVMLSGSNFATVIFSLSMVYSQTSGVRMEHLSYAIVHIRARAYFGMASGHLLGYGRGKDAGLMDDIRALRPTILPLSPSLAENMRAEIKEYRANSNPLARRLFGEVFSRRLSQINGTPLENTPVDSGFLASAASRIAEHSLAQRLAFMPYRALLGGRVALITHGNRPLLVEDIAFMKVVLGAAVVQIYGATETCGQGFSSSSAEVGRMGGVMPLIQAKLVDCPELEYSVADQPYPRGEIWVRGPSLFMGYYNKPLREPGTWYPTGDIAMLSPTLGKFAIIDRKDNFFKLASGRYIIPEKVESAYKRLPLVDDMYVPSEKGVDAAVAIVNPHPQEFLGWVAYNFQQHAAPTDFAMLCAKPEVRQAFCKAINRSVTSLKALPAKEQVQRVCLVPEAFSGNPDLVTPSKKLKRNQLKRHFAPQIAELLQELPQPPSNSSPSPDPRLQEENGHKQITKSKL
ncbi:medium-chain fatty acid-CoA ligase faa2, variant 2 [Entomophthora muscae]|uniref:Medium-chain fatty acid-CoA ligase faa2, variant 2 n=1 Tax=Entomophthora muscae TaxID=34485 RepID=A0ACC2ULY8_9FUNG|nr:medium-chain fatty acid-CoA ligase faa2, variant 2 [Entomophthora muscae]